MTLYDLDSDRLPSKEDTYEVLAKINQKRPLPSGRAQPTDGKQGYSVEANGKTLRMARLKAEALITKREQAKTEAS